MTSGMHKNINKNEKNHRDLESIEVLSRFGIEQKNIFFLGRKLSINNNKLYKSMDKAYNELFQIIKNIKGKKIIFTHALEGGHEDHDACFYLAKLIFFKNKSIYNAYQFPAYNGKKMPYIFFKVFSRITENGKIFKKKFKFQDRLKFIYLLFFYKSQKKIWFGLYPFVIFKFLFSKTDLIQEINKKIKIRRPHDGKLLYEKRGFCDYKLFEKKVFYFLKKNI